MSEGWLGFQADFTHLRKAFSLLAKLSRIYSKLYCSCFQVYVPFCGEVLYWYWDILQNWSRRARQRFQPFSCRKKTNHSRWVALFFYFFLHSAFHCEKDFACMPHLIGLSLPLLTLVCTPSVVCLLGRVTSSRESTWVLFHAYKAPGNPFESPCL